MIFKLWYCVLLLFFTSGSHAMEHTYNVVETEMFAIQISPKLFNWTYQLFDEQYLFQASLIGKPDLVSWLKYIYSKRHHSGFIYGTPPRGTKSPVTLLVLGKNHQDFNTRKLYLNLKIHKREKVAVREVEMKIDNLNVEDLLDDRMTRLKDIFRNKLWPESSADLYVTFLSSAVDMGARLPLKPGEGEGVVVRVGSSAEWSGEVVRVRSEVRPLSRLGGYCPRDYKRTTVERHFREHHLAMDWCHFYLYNTIYQPNGTISHIDYLSETPSQSMKTPIQYTSAPDIWSAPRRADLPSRNYLLDFLIAVVVPVLIMVVFVAGLTGVLCFRYAGVGHKSNVSLCRYQEPHPVVTTDPSPGHSLSVSLSRPKSSGNVSAEFKRPQPPPYGGIKRPPADTVRNLALEDSIKLLNEANIGNYKVIDFADGCDDYVPIKPDETGYVRMEPDNTGFAVLDGDVAAREVPI